MLVELMLIIFETQYSYVSRLL